MDFYYTLEEKILYATSLLCTREFAKAKLKLEEVLETEPDNGRVHFLIGWIYFTQLSDYKKAERHFHYAVKFAPGHPDVFYSYLRMLNQLNKQEELIRIAEKALIVNGVCKAYVHHQLGLSCEKNGNYSEAFRNFKQANLHATDKYDTEEINESLTRIENKLLEKEMFVYIIK
jgi:tetratricopeptide (TPR) repeat protein